MSAYIEMNQLDLIVLGQVQHDFTVDGVHGLDLAAACVQSTFKRAVSVETEISAISEAIKARSRRTYQYGEVMSLVSGASAYIGNKMTDADTLKDPKSGELLKKAKTLIETTYALDIPDYTTDMINGSTGDIQVSNLKKLKENVKYALDQEDNSLQRNLSTLQSVMGKRDSAMSLVGRIQKRISKTEAATIRNIGR